MKVQIKKWSLIPVATCCLLMACDKENNEYVEPAARVITYDRNGVLIASEGAFGAANGTISFFSKDSVKCFNDIFENANANRHPGDVVQSVTSVGTEAYIIANASNTLEYVNLSDFKSNGTISLNLPRYSIDAGNNKLYVSCWETALAPGKIQVINTTSKTISATINTGTGPEKMLRYGDNIFVVNCGGYLTDSTITVINRNTDNVVSTIQLGNYNPSSIALDASGKLWVMCCGYYDFVNQANNIPGAIIKIDATTLAIENTFSLSNAVYQNSNKLAMNSSGNKVFYIDQGNFYAVNTTASSLSSTPFIARDFYSFAVDPYTNDIYAGIAPNFTSAGRVIRYSSNANVIDSFNVGIAPTYFNFVQ